MNEYDDKEWHVFEFVPDLVVAHSGIRAGEPTIKGTRVPTWTASNAYVEGDWRNYRIKKGQAFAALCFEAGREYEKKKRKINKAVEESWDRYMKIHYPEYEREVKDERSRPEIRSIRVPRVSAEPGEVGLSPFEQR